jgi:hypothetical protein
MMLKLHVLIGENAKFTQLFSLAPRLEVRFGSRNGKARPEHLSSAYNPIAHLGATLASGQFADWRGPPLDLFSVRDLSAHGNISALEDMGNQATTLGCANPQAAGRSDPIFSSRVIWPTGNACEDR